MRISPIFIITIQKYNMQKRIIVCLIATVISVSFLRAQTQLKILSYNIFHGEDLYKKQPNLDSIAVLINAIQPDLVALQEVDSMTGRSEKVYGKRINYVQLLADKTNMFGYFGKAMDYDGGGYGEGVLTRKKALATTTLLPTPSGGEPRSVIGVEYPLSSNRKILFAATHLCHQFMPNKLAQVEKLNNLFAGTKHPAILAGDLNFKPQDEPYSHLAQHWLDAAIVHGNPQPTYPTDKPERRIDYIWLSQNQSWKVVDFQVLPQAHSDHRAVLLTVEIK